MSNSNPNGFENRDIGARIYTRFTESQSYTTASIAEKMGIKPDTLRRYINGQVMFPADRIPAFVKATDDPYFIQILCDACGYYPIKRIDDPELKKGDFLDLSLDAFSALCASLIAARIAAANPEKVKYQEAHDKLFKAIAYLFEIEQRLKKIIWNIFGKG